MEEVDDEAIANFCAVTGADDSTARHLLAASNGDLDSAVSLYLDGGASVSTGQPREIEPDVRAPIQPQRAILVDEANDNSSFSYPHISPLVFTPVEPFRDFRSETLPFLRGQPNDERGRRLAELFRPPTEIMFLGSLESARKQARDERRWLLVTVHNPSDFPCQMMIRDVWNDRAVQDFIRESLVLVFLTIGTSEAERYRQYYPFDGFPHWALIDPRTGKRTKTGSMAMKGPEMLMELVEFVSEHSLQASAKHKSPVSAGGALSNKLENSEETKVAKNSSIILPPEPSADNHDSLLIQMRLPDGSRHRRRFLKSELVQVLFDYASSIDSSLCEDSIDIVLSPGKSLKEFKESKLDNHGLRNAALTVIP